MIKHFGQQCWSVWSAFQHCWTNKCWEWCVIQAPSTLMRFRLKTHTFFIRFRLPSTLIRSKTEVYVCENGSSIGSGGSDAVLQTAPEKAATPYTTIQIFSSSAAQEITKWFLSRGWMSDRVKLGKNRGNLVGRVFAESKNDGFRHWWLTNKWKRINGKKTYYMFKKMIVRLKTGRDR